MKKALLGFIFLLVSLWGIGQTTINTLPYVETFDNYGVSTNDYQVGPQNWLVTLVNSSITNNVFPYITGQYSYSAPGSLFIGQGASARLPQIANSIPMDSLRIKFKLMSTVANSTLKLNLSDGSIYTENLIEFASITPTDLNTWQEYEVWIDTANALYSYIKLSSGTIDSIKSLYIDDIEISYQNTCDRPINLNVTSISTNSATMSFTSQDNETQWKIQYKSTFDSSWVNATTVSNITTNPYTINGLINSTPYDVRIKAICSPTEESDWTDTRFHTSISTLPYFNSFDNYGTELSTIPYGWTKINDNNNATSTIIIYNYSPPVGFIFASKTTDYNYLITPKFDTQIQLNSLRVKFQFTAFSTPSRLIIGVMTDPTDTSSFVQVGEVNSSLIYNWEEKEVLLSSYNGNGKYIAFRAPSNSQVAIDNLEISTIPSCIRPKNITLTNISAYSASISFIPQNNESQWELQHKLSTDTLWANATTSNFTTNSYTINGLTSKTAYDFRVRAICSTNDSSEWIYSSFFTAIDSLPWADSFDSYGTGGTAIFPKYGWSKIVNYFSDYVYISSGGFSSSGTLRFYTRTNPNNYAIAPKIDNSIPINALRAKFKLKIQNINHKLIVGVMSDPRDTSTFVQVEELSLNVANTWKDVEVLFNSYNGNGQYIAFKSKNIGTCNIYIDDFEISTLPSCVRPSQIYVSNITPTSMDVAWFANNNTNHWEIEYKPYSDTSWQNAVRISSITTNPFYLTNLQPSTVLSLRIRAICSSTDSSEWTYYEKPIYGENLDFSYGNFVNWKAYYATNTSTTILKQFSNWTQTIADTNDMVSNAMFVNIYSDTNANDNLIPALKTIPTGYTHSASINKYDYYAQIVSKLQYDLDVDYSNYLLTLNYAIVFTRFNYNGLSGSNFSIEVLNLVDSNGVFVENGRVFPDSYYDTIGVLTPSGWNYSESNPNYNWKPWTEMKLDLSSKIGQKVRVKIITAKPREYYHKAYSYFAGKTEGFEQATCYPPLTVNVDDVGSTYANISFDRTMPIDSNWLIQYREIGDSVWNYVSFDTNNYVLNNLSPESNYEAFVQTLCTDSTYSDSSQFITFSTTTLNIDSMFNNQTAYLCGKYFYDDGGQDNNHSNNTNYTFTICPTRKAHQTINIKRVSVNFEEFSLGQGDVMRAFSGRSINPQTQLSIGSTFDFTGNFLVNKSLIANLSDTSGCITFNLITNASDSSSGFKAYADCIDRCQNVIADLDTFFIKYDSLGNTSTHLIKAITDSVYSATDNSWTYNTYRAIDFCEGDLITLVAKPQFPDNNSYYNQSMNNCIYYWSFGDRTYDTVHYNNMVGHIWTMTKAYELELNVLDTTFSYLNGVGCRSNNNINTMIRMTQNPIKEVKSPIDICSGTPFILNVGFDTNSTIVIDSIKRVERISGLFDSLVIIPDGPVCPSLFMETSIFFDEFLPNETFDNISDIRSICINMEHSFTGDISIELYCPTGQKTILKHYNHSGSAKMGQPIDVSVGCEMSPSNPPGIGWTYCFSNQYLDSARGVISGNMFPVIDSSNTINNTKYFQTPVQNATSAETGLETPDLNGFNSLIGCPLNGEWKLRIADYWGIDNGFLFWWKLDLGQITTWDYQASLDTIIVEGLNAYNLSNDTVVITPPIDTSGIIRYEVSVIDDFGCIWDTATYLNVAQSPVVNLGKDTSSCEQFSIVLDCGNPDAFSYLWLPYGDTTQSIIAQSLSDTNSLISYIAQVTNYNGSIYCISSDTINLINLTPLTPINLNIETQTSSFLINWQASAQSYELYRNDSLIAITQELEYIDTNLILGNTYCYKIKALSGGCESIISNEVCEIFLDINTIETNSFNALLYPNPTNNKTILKVEGLKESTNVSIYDMSGKKLRELTLNPTQTELELDFSDFVKGVYTIRITNSTINITKKLVKQ
jgi:subtilisin-like proprotein convertase family protein